jgi:hypothetical protein
MTKKDRDYFRTLPWEGLKRWVKYGTNTDTNWQELAVVLVERRAVLLRVWHYQLL